MPLCGLVAATKTPSSANSPWTKKPCLSSLRSMWISREPWMPMHWCMPAGRATLWSSWVTLWLALADVTSGKNATMTYWFRSQRSWAPSTQLIAKMAVNPSRGTSMDWPSSTVCVRIFRSMGLLTRTLVAHSANIRSLWCRPHRIYQQVRAVNRSKTKLIMMMSMWVSLKQRRLKAISRHQ